MINAIRSTLLIILPVLVVLLTSCQQDIDDIITPTNPPPPGGGGSPDSLYLLHGTGGTGFVYKPNDSLVWKMYYFNYPTSLYDTTYFYYTGTKIARMVTLGGAPSDYFKVCVFPVYTGDKITKVYEKRAVYATTAEFYDENFLSTLGPVSPSNIYAYDSIVYDAKGRIKANYRRVADGSQFKIQTYDELDYVNPNMTPNTGGDSLLYRVKLFEDMGFTGTFTEHNKLTFYEYEFSHGKANPMYRSFKEYAYFARHPMTWLRAIHPVDGNSNDFLDRYIALNPYPVKRIEMLYIGLSDQWVTYTLRHEYKPNGLLDNSYCDNIFAHGVTGYSYEVRPRP